VKKTLSLFQVFKLNSQFNKLVIHTYIWFASGFSFYGLMLNVGSIGDNIYLNSIITYVGEGSAEMISGYLANLYGRLFVFRLYGYLGGVSFLLVGLVTDPVIQVALVFMTSFGLSGLFNIMYIYSPEVFPTSIRSTVIGYLYLISRTGALLVPTFSAIVKRSWLVFAIMTLVSCFMTRYLKESLGCAIEDEVPELRDISDEKEQCLLQKISVSKKDELTNDSSDTLRGGKFKKMFNKGRLF
jgi:OCT family organic cation transporter-like MFS transporter 4/5